jgi:hypothetical protein
MADTKDKIRKGIDDAGQKAKDVAGKAVDKTKEAGQKAKDVAGKAVDKTKEAASEVGKTVKEVGQDIEAAGK